MREIKPLDLKIGTELYQYSSKILSYEITGISELKTKEHTEIFYILKCLSCNDHNPCELAIKFNDRGGLIYSHMINNDEDNDQSYWHRNEKYNWFLTRKDARLFIHNKNIEYYKDNIKKAEESIINNNKKIEEELDKINALTE